MTGPLILDLFCKAGGAAAGYAAAGFDIVGVDIEPQPHYPYTFIRGDAMEWLSSLSLLRRFDAVHASPPCQSYSVTASLHNNVYPALIEPIRAALKASGRPYVIENVVGAPLLNPVRLCGSSFGLGVRRHRLFEIHGFEPGLVPPCAHHDQPEPVDVTGTGGPFHGIRKAPGGGVSRKPRNLAHAREVMGIDWMTRRELSEAIPPAYTAWIGERLLSAVMERAA